MLPGGTCSLQLESKYAPQQGVIDSISSKYKYISGSTIKKSDAVAHLQWLFWNLPLGTKAIHPEIGLCSTENICIRPNSIKRRAEDIFFETDGDYGASELCGEEVHYLLPAYLEAVSADARHDGQSWIEWLETVVGVRRFPRLHKAADPSQLSAEFAYILESRPEMLIGTLNAHWSSYNKPRMSIEVAKILSETKVPCQGSNTNTELRHTYLPTPSLVGLAQDLDAYEEIPFLRLPEELGSLPEEEWEFLKVFGTQGEECLEFYLDILECFMRKEHVQAENIFKVYETIEKNYTSENDVSTIK